MSSIRTVMPFSLNQRSSSLINSLFRPTGPIPSRSLNLRQQGAISFPYMPCARSSFRSVCLKRLGRFGLYRIGPLRADAPGSDPSRKRGRRSSGSFSFSPFYGVGSGTLTLDQWSERWFMPYKSALSEYSKDSIFKAEIPRAIRIAEASAYGQTYMSMIRRAERQGGGGV